MAAPAAPVYTLGLMEPEETRLIKSAVEFSDKTAGEINT